VQNLLGGHSKNSVTLPYLEIVKIGNFIYRVFKKSSPLIFFGIFSLRLSLFA